MHHDVEEPAASASDDRRTLLSSAAMAGGLLAGYGAFAAIAARFLYPARPTARSWLYVARVDELRPGQSLAWRTPGGVQINIARRGDRSGVEDFVALSSTCPHLGCRVHWEAANRRFFCPCHNGIFTPEGKAIGGPPAEAGQSLATYPLRIDGGLLYIEVPLETLTAQAPLEGGPEGPGHDPCLSRPFPGEA